MPKFEPRLIDQFLVEVPRLVTSEVATIESLRGSGAASLCASIDTLADRAASASEMVSSAVRWSDAAAEVGTEIGAVWVGPPGGFRNPGWLSSANPGTRRSAIADLLSAVDGAATVGAKTIRVDLGGESATIGIDVPAALDHLSDAVNAMLAYSLAQEVELEVALVTRGGLFENSSAAIAWIADLDFEEQVGLEVDIASVSPSEIGSILWHDKLFLSGCSNLGAVSGAGRSDALWAVVQLEDAEWSGWRSIGIGSETEESAWGSVAHHGAITFLRMQDAARDFLAEDEIGDALDVLTGRNQSERTLPNGRSLDALTALRANRSLEDQTHDAGEAVETVRGALVRYANELWK